MSDPIDGASLARWGELQGSRIRVQVLKQCASTNTHLLALARAGAPHASAIVCEQQTQGRGRHGKTWISNPGQCLTFSLLWRFDSRLSRLAALSLVVALASVRALEAQGAVGIKLKWPNDLLFDGRKLGGILVETFHQDDKTVAVIGIGLNVSHSRSLQDQIDRSDTLFRHAVADLGEAGVRADRSAILVALLGGVEAALEVFAAEGFAGVREEWLLRHAWQGRQVCLGSADRVEAEGEALGVAEDGALLIRSDGVVRAHYSGELSLRPV